MAYGITGYMPGLSDIQASQLGGAIPQGMDQLRQRALMGQGNPFQQMGQGPQDPNAYQFEPDPEPLVPDLEEASMDHSEFIAQLGAQAALDKRDQLRQDVNSFSPQHTSDMQSLGLMPGSDWEREMGLVEAKRAQDAVSGQIERAGGQMGARLDRPEERYALNNGLGATTTRFDSPTMETGVRGTKQRSPAAQRFMGFLSGLTGQQNPWAPQGPTDAPVTSLGDASRAIPQPFPGGG